MLLHNQSTQLEELLSSGNTQINLPSILRHFISIKVLDSGELGFLQ